MHHPTAILFNSEIRYNRSYPVLYLQCIGSRSKTLGYDEPNQTLPRRWNHRPSENPTILPSQSNLPLLRPKEEAIEGDLVCSGSTGWVNKLDLRGLHGETILENDCLSSFRLDRDVIGAGGKRLCEAAPDPGILPFQNRKTDTFEKDFPFRCAKSGVDDDDFRAHRPDSWIDR